MNSIDDLANEMADIEVKGADMQDSHESEGTMTSPVIDINDPSYQVVDFDGMEEVGDDMESDGEENEDVKAAIAAAIAEPQWGDDDVDGDMGQDSETIEASAPVADDSSLVFSGHTDSVYTLDVCPTNENIIVSGGGDDRAFAFDATTGTVSITIHLYQREYNGLVK